MVAMALVGGSGAADSRAPSASLLWANLHLTCWLAANTNRRLTPNVDGEHAVAGTVAELTCQHRKLLTTSSREIPPTPGVVGRQPRRREVGRRESTEGDRRKGSAERDRRRGSAKGDRHAVASRPGCSTSATSPFSLYGSVNGAALVSGSPCPLRSLWVLPNRSRGEWSPDSVPFGGGWSGAPGWRRIKRWLNQGLALAPCRASCGDASRRPRFTWNICLALRRTTPRTCPGRAICWDFAPSQRDRNRRRFQEAIGLENASI